MNDFNLEYDKDWVKKDWVKSGQFKEENSYNCARKILKKSGRPTAMIAMNNFSTIGLMRTVKDLKIKVPKKLSIIGFDDAEWMKICTPSITTISQPAYVMDMTAATLILDLMEGPDLRQPRKVVLKTTLIERESVSIFNK